MISQGSGILPLMARPAQKELLSYLIDKLETQQAVLCQVLNLVIEANSGDGENDDREICLEIEKLLVEHVVKQKQNLI